MPIEYEAKVLDVDPAQVARTIINAGGIHTGDSTMRRYVYDINPGETDKWIRLRDNGDTTTLAVKQIHHDRIDGTTETETSVGDFDTTNKILALLGYTPKSYQENSRSSYQLDDVQLEIDTWPLIPPYLEIEGPDTEAVHRTAQHLGYTVNQLTSANTTKIYAHYGIDLTAIRELRLGAPTRDQES